MIYRRTNIRKDLIDQYMNELIEIYEKDFKILHCNKCKLSNRLIDKLHNQYYCHEYIIKFYDTDPKFPPVGKNDKGCDYDIFDMYLDYNNGYYIENEKYSEEDLKALSFTGKCFTKDELKQVCDEVLKIYEQYEERRLTFNNWIDVYGEGIWGQTQDLVDYNTKLELKDIQKWKNLSDRVYCIETLDPSGKKHISLYIYGRDIHARDYVFSFVRRDKHKKRRKSRIFDYSW